MLINRNWIKLEEFLSEILYGNNKKIIGWGTGRSFRYYNSLFPIKLDYIIDNSKEKQGKYINDVPVYSPEQLRNEDPENVIIIIYSTFFLEIAADIDRMGNFVYFSSDVLYYQESLYYNKKISDIVTKDIPKRQKDDAYYDEGILIQGPLIKHITQEILKYYTFYYKNVQIIVSTWENADPRLIQEIEPYCDHIILNKPPENGGVQNRNYLLKSTIEGLKYAKSIGVEKILKTRSDTLVLNNNIFSICNKIQGLYDKKIVNSYGLKNRIIVPENFTRKYILYHPSDMIMYGDVEDLLIYWDVNLDTREYSLINDETYRNMTLKEISDNVLLTECYLANAFCNKIGRQISGTLKDSWDFYRDFFIVLDNCWFDFFWYKHIKLPDIQPLVIEKENINRLFWEELYFGTINEEIELNKVNIERSKWYVFVEKIEDL